MVTAFGARLNSELADFSLAPDILHDIQAGKIKLAGLQVPASLDSSTKAGIKEAVGAAFLFGFRVIVLVCAGLAVAGAAVSWLLIPTAEKPPSAEADS
jgi:hypothetical protein